jgi:hypothetical protein
MSSVVRAGTSLCRHIPVSIRVPPSTPFIPGKWHGDEPVETQLATLFDSIAVAVGGPRSRSGVSIRVPARIIGLRYGSRCQRSVAAFLGVGVEFPVTRLCTFAIKYHRSQMLPLL